jgi:hypothetical protein
MNEVLRHSAGGSRSIFVNVRGVSWRRHQNTLSSPEDPTSVGARRILIGLLVQDLRALRGDADGILPHLWHLQPSFRMLCTSRTTITFLPTAHKLVPLGIVLLVNDDFLRHLHHSAECRRLSCLRISPTYCLLSFMGGRIDDLIGRRYKAHVSLILRS